MLRLFDTKEVDENDEQAIEKRREQEKME
jgi:signal-transduction protein with cAMP-binding, CBS, and nucleotidyltransferase domain